MRLNLKGIKQTESTKVQTPPHHVSGSDVSHTAKVTRPHHVELQKRGVVSIHKAWTLIETTSRAFRYVRATAHVSVLH